MADTPRDRNTAGIAARQRLPAEIAASFRRARRLGWPLLAVLASAMLLAAGCKDDRRESGGTRGPAASGPASAPASARAESRPAPMQFKLTSLASTKLGVSDSPQSVAYQDRIKVTVPGGLVKAPAVLTISAIADPPPPDFSCLRQAAVYDVSMTGAAELDKDLLIEMPYDPNALPKGHPPQAVLTVACFDPVDRVWANLPCAIDTQRHVVTARTRHLCPVSILVWTPGEDDEELHVSEGIDDAEIVIYYNRKQVQRATFPTYKKVDPPETPGYVAAVRDAAWNARTAYKKYGLELNAKPLFIYMAPAPHSGHNAFTGNVTINFVTQDPNDLGYAVAHEMLHNVERNYYYWHTFWAHRWWLEASAEYAASRLVVRNYPFMGKTDVARMSPKFLTQYLTYAHTPSSSDDDPAPKPGSFTDRLGIGRKDPWRYHAYQGAFFLEYLCRTGVSLLRDTEPTLDEPTYFARMFKYVSTHGYVTTNSLNEFLVSQHGAAHDLAHQYVAFVMQYLFDPSSRMPKDAATPEKMNPAAVEETLVLEENDDQEHVVPFLNLPNGHSVKLQRIVAKVPKGDQWRAVSVEALRRNAPRVWLYVLRLPGDKRGAVDVQGLFVEASDDANAVIASVGPDDALYLLAVNNTSGETPEDGRPDDFRTVGAKVKDWPLKITDVTPPSAAPGETVTIRGQGFGKDLPLNHPNGLWFGANLLPVREPQAWSDTAIQVRVPQQGPAKFQVRRDGRTSNAVHFAVKVGDYPPGTFLVNYRWRIQALNHPVQLPDILLVEVSPGGAVQVLDYSRTSGKKTVIGRGDVKPNPSFVNWSERYLWKSPFVYTFSAYPMSAGQKTVYTVRGGFDRGFMMLNVSGGALSHPPTSGPATRSATSQPANFEQADVIDKTVALVQRVYGLQVRVAEYQELCVARKRQAADLEARTKVADGFVVPPSAAPEDTQALLALINQTRDQKEKAWQEMRKQEDLCEKADKKLHEALLAKRYPPSLPYDRPLAELQGMVSTLEADIEVQRKQWNDLGEQLGKASKQLDDTIAAKLPKPPPNPEKERLRGELAYWEALLGIYREQVANRQARVKELEQQAASAAPQPPPADQGPGITLQIPISFDGYRP